MRTKQRFLFIFILLIILPISFFWGEDFYWETPLSLSKKDSRFPKSASNKQGYAVVVWEEITNSSISLSMQVNGIKEKNSRSNEWKSLQNVAGPFIFSGEVPDIFSVTVDEKDRIIIAVLSEPDTISIYISSNNGQSFKESRITSTVTPLIAPRIFKTASGSLMLFAVQGEEDSFSLMASESITGDTWPNFVRFAPSVEVSNAFVPTLLALPDSDLVVFQGSYSTGQRLSYQLYSTVRPKKRAVNRANTGWEKTHLITDKVNTSQPFYNYHNQRANIFYLNGKVNIAWERTYYSSEYSHVYIAEMTSNGLLSTPGEQLSPDVGSASVPSLFSHNSLLNIVWFDTRRGTSSVYMGQKTGILWEETALTTGTLDASFANPIVTVDNDLHVFWQQKQANNTYRINRLSPDRSSSPPELTPSSYTAGKKSAANKVTVNLLPPKDSSGIAGFAYSWSQDPEIEPSFDYNALPTKNKITVNADNDGVWFLKARVLDYAGNWSLSSLIEYKRDTTPPAAPVIEMPELDDNGYLKSNTFALSWNPSDPEDDLAGYTYSLEYMATLPSDPINIPLELSQRPTKPPSRIMTTKNSVSWNNRDDGIYAFSVAAIDSVGNIGEPLVVQLNMNKYVPYTIITSIDAKTDEYGTVALSFIGRGYTRDGEISAIYISRKTSGIYDRVLEKGTGEFTVKSDRWVTGITLSDLEPGSYRIGVLHSGRGLYWTRPLVKVAEFGTVKTGDYSHKFIPSWNKITKHYTFSTTISDVLIVVVFILALMGVYISIRGMTLTAKETLIVKKEVLALITGDDMPQIKKEKAKKLKRRGTSLKYKLMFFSSVLVLVIILLVSLPLGFIMTRTQEQTLAQGLKDRTDVLLESLASGVKAYMPSQNVLELSFLPEQSSAIPEAIYTTILGMSADGKSTGLGYVWATNDPEIQSKIDTETLAFGQSRITDPRILTATDRCFELETKAGEVAGDIAKGISELTVEGVSLALKTDKASIERLEEIQTITRQLSEKLTLELTRISKENCGTLPEYSTETFSRTDTNFTFYKPVLYRQGSEQNFVRAVIVIEVSTQNMLRTVDEARDSIIYTAAIIALLAILIGVIGSLAVASYIIRPIRRLVTHVAMIRDTDDKEELQGKDILLKSKDEIGILGETVNEMTHGLVKAAAAAKDLTVGKEVQKMFIPLEVDSQGRKLTTGKIDDDRTQFFGYYEGAKGVSGDYFDYLKLDDKHYAIIKCDVSGKGVPAALIMVEVATLFLHYFKDWSYQKNKYDLGPVVSQINDLIESRGFKGRFAAFTLCIYNSLNGEIHFCNAGDNLIHIYDAETGKKKTIAIQESAAAGVFPTFMVDMKGGFKVSSMKLKPGDVLFLYTDGIEEAKRLFRDSNLNTIVCAEPGLPPEAPHGYHSVGQDGEEMAPERVNAIIEAVFHRTSYKLEKYHNPIPDEVLEFDFSTCEGTAEEAIMALVSVEKIFRMYKNPKANEFNRVQVDCKIDTFLNEHFLQYSDYCSRRKPHPEFAEYMYYTHICEDDQYDDLTLIAIKRKK